MILFADGEFVGFRVRFCGLSSTLLNTIGFGRARVSADLGLRAPTQAENTQRHS